MRTIGLTGGIGAGKSTVAEFLRRRGAVIIDADEIARETLATGSSWLQEVAEMFGPEILGADGALDRPRLAQIIFSDPAAREWLNALCHPPIIAEVSRNIAALRAETPPPEVVVVVAPLLFEAKAESLVEKVVVVTATEQERVRRLQERDKVSEEEIRARFAAQLPEEEKQSRAAWVIDTTAGLEDTEHQVEVLWQELVAPRP